MCAHSNPLHAQLLLNVVTSLRVSPLASYQGLWCSIVFICQQSLALRSPCIFRPPAALALQCLPLFSGASTLIPKLCCPSHQCSKSSETATSSAGIPQTSQNECKFFFFFHSFPREGPGIRQLPPNFPQRALGKHEQKFQVVQLFLG